MTVVGIFPCVVSIQSFSLNENEITQTLKFLSLEDELENKILQKHL
jgi:hypothetical protein